MDEGRPSRASLREVKREARARRDAERERARSAEAVWYEMTGRRRRRGPRPTAIVAGLAGATLLVAGGIAAWTLLDPPAGGSLADARTTVTAAPAVPSSAPVGATADAVFTGTPAETWPIGTAGIKVPRVPVRDRYIGEVAASMRSFMQRYLVASLVDERVVMGEDVEPFLKVLGPERATELVADLRAQADADRGKVPAWDSYLNRFRSQDWTSVAEPRVKGRTVVTLTSDNCVVFDARYAVAYGLQPRIGGPARAVLVRRDSTVTICTALFIPKPGYVLLSPSGYVSSASVCGADWPHTGYVTAWVDRDQVARMHPAAPGAATWDPSDTDTSAPSSCFTDTSGF